MGNDGRMYAKRCKCLTFEIEKHKETLGLKNLELPEELERMTFENFIPHLNNSDVYTKVRSFLKEWQIGQNLMLFGEEYGTGKTHLAVSILKELQKQGYSCGFMSATTYFEDVKARKFKDSELDQAGFSNSQILLIDDIAITSITEWEKKIYYYIFNKRYTKHLTTLITLNIAEFEELKEIIGGAAFSRFYSKAKLLKFPATMKDFRIEHR